MTPDLTTVFYWNDTHQEKNMVAASASSDWVEIYYALENKCARHGTTCTVSSHAWFDQPRRYMVEQYLVLD